MRYALAMPRRSRLRTFAARASLTMLIALVVVWAASAWLVFYWLITPHSAVGIGRGTCGLFREDRGTLDAQPFVQVIPSRSRRWSFEFSRHTGPGYSITSIPLWAFATPLALTTALLWRSELAARRRARAGLCPKCRYDLAANPNGAPCPECGTPTNSAAAASIDATPPTA